jgi:hypothetical protein
MTGLRDVDDPSSAGHGQWQDLANTAWVNPRLDENVAGKFKILACSSTSCTTRRRELRLDKLATYSALYVLSQERAPSVQLFESPCLGECRDAPCVAVEHDDYEGTVSLLGMQADEFARRVFLRVVGDSDIDRVWSCVESAIEAMETTNASPEASELTNNDLSNESRYV